MLIDRVLADLDVPDPEERAGKGHSSPAYMREWKTLHAAAVKRYLAEYRRRKAREVKASSVMWRRRNPEKVRTFKQRDRARHRQRIYADNMRRRALKLRATVEPIDFAAILIRDAGRCGICGRPVAPAELHFDHIRPIARGGSHTADNIQVAHRRCNLKKGTL